MKTLGARFAPFRWDQCESMLVPHIPSTIVNAQQRKELFRFLKGLKAPFYWGMFETRLGVEGGPIDVLGALLPTPASEDWFEAQRQVGLDENFAPLSRVLSAWQRRDTQFGRTPNLWIEWDRDGSGSAPLPWLCIAPHFFDRGSAAPTLEEVVQLCEEFMQSSDDLYVDGATETVRSLGRRLPPGCTLMGFASLKPRGRSACRLFVKLPPGGTLAWLRAIDWPGDWDEMLKVAPLFQVPGEAEWCQVEFDSRLSDHLALELGQTESGFPRKEARMAWLTEVAERGLACPTKAAEVLDWHGRTRGTHQGIPYDLRRSFHLKLALGSNCGLRAKAYLGFYLKSTRRASLAT